MAEPEKQICIIRIVFPVDSDEQAITCKKKIAEAMSDLPNSQISFNLTSRSSAIDASTQIR